MEFKKIKNGKKIIVKDWSSTIEIYNNNTGEFINKADFQDHITAVYLAKKL